MYKNSLIFFILLALSIPCQAGGDPGAGKEKSQTCAACHGVDGNSTTPQWPKLAGQHPGYLAKQLLDFREGRRSNPQMSPMAASLSDQDIADLSAFYASQKKKNGKAQPVMLDTGETIYRAGDLEAGVAACTACHGPHGRGNPAANYPLLSGQHAAYIETQLNNFRENKRTNDVNQVMRSVVNRMTDEEIKAVSNYIQGLH